MQLPRGESERIRAVLAEEDINQPLTAREIYQLLDERDEAFDSPHQVATVLGRPEASGIEVIKGQPYRYRLTDRS